MSSSDSGEGALVVSLHLFDDGVARSWQPFQLTRPLGEVLFGCLLLRERAERFLGTPASAHLAGERLVGFQEEGAPPVVSTVPREATETRVFLSSRFVPAGGTPPELPRHATLSAKGATVGWVVPHGEPVPADDWLLDPASAPRTGEVLELAGAVLEQPWHLVDANPRQITADVAWLHGGEESSPPAGVIHLGTHSLSLAEDVVVEPGVILDLRAGPIRLERGVRVQAPARLTGPLFVGASSTLLGGSVGTSSIGPVCKVRGEVDTSVLIGYCNKAHDGYLGHSLLGRWVNLGALTTNSDLKNNYSTVRVRLPSQESDTGLLKVGCFLGDHVKTGIGTLLNTGSIVGAGSNLFGGSMPPSYVPPFSWGSGSELVEFRLEKFLEVAEAAMARRNVDLTDGMRNVLSRAWEDSKEERR